MRYMNIRGILQEATSALEAAGRGAARLDAEVLLAHILTTDRAGLYRDAEETIGEKVLQDFAALVTRRCKGEPVAYLLGEKEFWSLDFFVDDRVLTPRPETEILIEETLSLAARYAEPMLRILEIGTGSGAVSIALASELHHALFWSTDISTEALAVARSNAERHALADRITFIAGDVFAPVTGKFHFIISNPPYIPEEEFDTLPVDVRQYEPRIALVGGRRGLDIHRELIRQAHRFLLEDGWMLLEMGHGQGPQIEALLQEDGHYEQITFRADYGGELRVVKAAKKKGCERIGRDG